jgi:hypothetical protein
VAYGVGAAVVGVLGLPPLRFGWLGVGIAIAAVIGLAVIARRRALKPSPLAIAAAAALAAEFLLQSLFRGSLGFQHGARSAYLYPASVFIWLGVAGTLGDRLDPRRWTGGRRLLVPAAVGALILPMALGNMVQFVLAARAMEPLRATELRELALMERLRETPGLALDTYADTAVLGPITARQYFAAVDQFGEPQLASGKPADDLPGPDAPALNALAVRLLGGAIAFPQDEAQNCSILATAAGHATWSPGPGSVAIHTTDAQAGVQLSLGVFDPADAPLDPAIQAIIARGAAFRLPDLPPPLAWKISIAVEGDAVVHICTSN